jgi:hypothetical protein
MPIMMGQEHDRRVELWADDDTDVEELIALVAGDYAEARAAFAEAVRAGALGDT